MASKSSRSGIVFILMSIFFRVIVNTKIQPLPSDISLIYGEYNNHKLYCKFETMQVIQKSEGLVEPVCFEKFKDMTQTLPDGNVTHPYLKYGAVKGYVPECEKLNVENGDVGTCYPGLKIPLVHTVCNYSCDPGFIATSLTVTCRLMGSQKNVSVQWWKDNDYFDPEKKESEYCKQLSIRNGKVGVCLKDSKHDLPHMFCNYSCDPGFLATNSNGNFHFELGNKYSFQRIKDEDLCIIKEPAVEPLVQEPENFTIPMAVLFPSLLTLIAIAVIIALPCTRRKMKAIFSGTEASSRPSCIQKENNETESTSLDIESHEQHTGDPCPTDGMAANDQTERHTQWKDSSPEECEQLLPVYPTPSTTIPASPIPAGPNDNRLSGTATGFTELPLDRQHEPHLKTYEAGNGENQGFNQNRAECKQVAEKLMPVEFKKVIEEWDKNPLNEESAVLENNDRHCGNACDVDMMADLTSDGSLCTLHCGSLNSRKENQCTTDVRFLLENQTNIYRLKLLGELEIIPERRRDQALVGYVVKNREALRFPSENSIKLQEETFKNKVDEKVSEHFLRHMSCYGHTIGMMLVYFADVGATNVLEVVLEVHKGCPFCETLRK